MALAWPIYAVIGGIALLAVAAFLIIKNWGVVSKFLISTWETVKTFFVGLWNNIVGIFQKAWDFIWNGLLNNKFIQIALAIFTPFIGLPIMIIKHWGAISGFFIGLWDGIVTGVKNIWSSITTFFSNLWNGITNIFKNAWDKIWNGLLNNKFIQIALSVFLPFIGLPIMIIKHWGAVSGFFVGLWNGIVTGVKNIWNSITTFFSNLWNGITNIFKTAWDKIWNGLLNNKFVQIALSIFTPFIGIPVVIIKNWDKITTFFKGLPTFFKGIWDNIVNGIEKSFNKMTKFFESLPSFFKGIGKSIINFLVSPINSGINLINGIKIDVPNWVPIIGGKKFGFDIPKIPSFNTGVRNFSGGLAYVHKDELVELPGGSNVYTKNETRSIANNRNNSSKATTNNYYITVNAKALVNEIRELENANQILKIFSNLAGVSI